MNDLHIFHHVHEHMTALCLKQVTEAAGWLVVVVVVLYLEPHYTCDVLLLSAARTGEVVYSCQTSESFHNLHVFGDMKEILHA